MLNQKQFCCLKFLSVNFNDMQICKGLRKPLYTTINNIRDTGPDTENTDHGPDMGFYGPLEPIKIENFEKQLIKC